MPKKACRAITALIFLRMGLDRSAQYRSTLPFSGWGAELYMEARPIFTGRARRMGYTPPPTTPTSAPLNRAQEGQLRSPDMRGWDTTAWYRANVVRKGSTAIGTLEARGAFFTFRARRYKLLDIKPASPAFPPRYTGPYMKKLLSMSGRLSKFFPSISAIAARVSAFPETPSDCVFSDIFAVKL